MCYATITVDTNFKNVYNLKVKTLKKVPINDVIIRSTQTPYPVMDINYFKSILQLPFVLLYGS